MAKFNKENANNIQAIFGEKTGVIISKKTNKSGNLVWKAMPAFAVFACACVMTVGFFVNRQKETDSGIMVDTANVETHQVEMPQMSQEADGISVTVYAPELVYDGWIWPTESNRISAAYDMKGNDRGIKHDHINIAGEEGDAVYSVADGTVTEAGYVSSYGNYVIVDYGDGILAKYGHLKEICVAEGDKVIAGEQIGLMGKTGLATGPNLAFIVYKDGEAINPIAQ